MTARDPSTDEPRRSAGGRQTAGGGARREVTRTPTDATIVQLHRGHVYPPSNGEEVRIWNTTKKFADFGDVLLVHPTEGAVEAEDDVRAVDVDNPFLEYKTSRIYAWNALFGLAADNPLDRLQTRRTVETVANRARDVDVVCCESPQMLRAGRRLADRFGAKLLLNKHNAMYDLLDQQLGLRPVPDAVRRRAVRNLRRFEQAGIDDADAVVFQSADDVAYFDIPGDVTVEVIPNGTDFEDIRDGGNPERVRRQLGLPEARPICLFVGAFDYDPNEVAGEVITKRLAPALPDVEFLLVGRDPPEASADNVRAPGFVDDLPGVLSLADVAICPLTLGSGTKLKMLDYLAAGLPVVTTEVGAQGLEVVDGETALVRDEWDEFASAVERLAESPELRESLSTNARALGERYAWDSLMDKYDSVFAELLSM